MKKVLVFGGTGFFGKKLVRKLIDRGDKVTICTRSDKNPFSDEVTHFKANRTDSNSLKLLGQHDWDFVYDQICYCSQEAQITSELFKGRVGKYIFTSTGSVYPMDVPESGATEEMFKPLEHKLVIGSKDDFNYGEGKRQAEAYFFQNSAFPISSLRFPIVLGHEDTTGRLNWHIKRIIEKKDIYFPNVNGKLSFITADDAANALIYYANHDESIYINVHTEQVCLKDLVKVIEKHTNSKVLYASREDKDNHSPYGIINSWGLDISRALKTGFKPNGRVFNLIEKVVKKND